MKTNNVVIVARETNFVSKVKSSVASWVNRKNNTFSSIIEEPVTNRQVLLISNFIMAMIVTMMVAASGVIATIVCLLWLFASFVGLKRGGMLYE